MVNVNWGGSGIEKVVYDWIVINIPIGSNIIELGAGHVSTNVLRHEYKLTSIEHNPEYANIYDKVNYILTPIKNDWYDLTGIKLPKAELVIIYGFNRKGILDNINLFNKKAKFLIHDTYRDEEIELSFNLGELLKRKPVFYTDGDFFCVI